MNTQIPLSQVLSFQNDTGTNVTQRIDKGQTKAFQLDERQAAYEYASKIGSYVYHLFCNCTIKGRSKTLNYGYAVPK